jgi:hypothetical protein
MVAEPNKLDAEVRALQAENAQMRQEMAKIKEILEDVLFGDALPEVLEEQGKVRPWGASEQDRLQAHRRRALQVSRVRVRVRSDGTAVGRVISFGFFTR